MEKRGWRRGGGEEEVEEKREVEKRGVEKRGWRRGGMKKVGPSQTMLNAQIFIQFLQFNQKISHHIIMND